MWRAFRSEWIKLRRRSGLIGALSMSALSMFGAYFGITRVTSIKGHFDGGITKAVLESSQGLPTLLGHVGEIILVIALIIVAAAMATEYSQGTLRNLLVCEPSRQRLLAGKFVALLVFVLLAMSVAMAGGVGAALVAASSHGVDTTQWFTSDGWANLTTVFGNLVLGVIAWCVGGLFAALLFRSPAAAVGVGLAYILVVERLIEGVWTDGSNWLFGSLINNVVQGGGVFVTTVPSSSYGRSLVGVCIYALALLVVGGVLFWRRDVTT